MSGTLAIYKYELTMGSNKLKLPVGAQILSAKEQFNIIVLYCMATPDYDKPKKEIRNFYCSMAGTVIHDYIGKFCYIDTVLLNSGSYVAHVFEELT